MRKPGKAALRPLYKEWHKHNDAIMMRPGKIQKEWLLRRQAEIVADIKRIERK